MKHTAVDWLYNNLKSHFEHDGDLLECVQMSMQQAKEIEKEQIIDANIAGMEFIPVDPNRYQEDAEQYYNETFSTKEK
jgi:hypothetical protein